MLDEAIDVLAGRRVAVLTGAGVSTDSGIPDYRSPGAPVRRPMSGPTFLADEAARRRYWVGGHLGWERFSTVQPNPGHRTLADLERRGIASGIITQNVDGLHLRAGSRRVVELHGTMRRVYCIRCGQVFDRRDIAARIADENPWLAVPDSIRLGPDGDVLPESTDGFVTPTCAACGGVLKPDIVFFGEHIRPTTFRAAESVVHGSDALLVVGSSLAVNSGIRLVDRARRRGMPVVIVNRGETRADRHAAVKVDAGASEVLTALAAGLPALT